MSQFEKYFSKQADGTYDIVRVEQPFIEQEYTECFDMNKLAAACLHKNSIDRIIRSDARNMVPIEKYLEAHVEYRAEKVVETGFEVKYSQNKKLQGRAQAEHAISMQAMVREVRHFIAHQKCTDCDMTNAHPTLNLWICDTLKIDCPKLREYVTNRAGKIAEIVEYAAEHGQTEVVEDGKTKPLDKAFVKYYLLAIVYGCGQGKIDRIEHKHHWIKEFKDEMDLIAVQICKLFPKLYADNKQHKIDQNKKYNFESSTMSVLMQYTENRVLMDMMAILHDMSPSHASRTALCFDGLMVPCESFDFNAFMYRCTSEIKIPGFRLEIKDMSEMHDAVAKQIAYNPATDYVTKYLKKKYHDELKTYEENKVSSFGRKTHREYVEDLTGKVWPSYKMLTAAAIQGIDGHIAVMSGVKRGNFLLKIESDAVPREAPVIQLHHSYWAIDKRCKTPEPNIKKITSADLFADLAVHAKAYDRIKFQPINHGQVDQTSKGTLNTYPGFKASYTQEPNMDLVWPWIEHLKNVFCAGSESALDWLLEWHHRAFTVPSHVTRKVLVFKSTEHQIAGKGFYWHDFIRQLVYGDSLAIKQAGVEWVSDRFNTTLENTLLHVCEEAKTVFDPNQGIRDYERLKDLSGGESVMIEQKGKDKRLASIYANVVVLSNNEHVINVDQNDKRVAMFECDVSIVKRMGKANYFNTLAQFMTQESADAFYSYCINYSSKCDFSEIPQTSLRERVLEHSKNPAQLFMDAINEIAIDNLEYEWQFAASQMEEPYKATDLYNCFREFARENGITDISQRKFGQYMTTTNYVKTKIRSGMVYSKKQ